MDERDQPISVETWITRARLLLHERPLAAADLDELAALLPGAVPPARQRLLYLHCKDMAPTAEVIAWSFHPGEDPGGAGSARPYRSVLSAMEDGWRVIHFPQQLAPFDDQETDIVGFEFVLEKLAPAG